MALPDWSPLIEAALAVRRRAHAPYSRFLVGAAGEDHSGGIHTGCNVENATYGLTVCAERVAVCKAVSEGFGPPTFRRIAIVADTPELTPPCGACRQILWEFCGDIPVLLVNLAGASREFRLAALFPHAFDNRFL
jgi:cytidine deaminase